MDASMVTHLVRNRYLLYNLVRRELSSRFVGSMAGWFWALVHPVILLVVYTTVFVYILQVRLGPEVRQNFAEFLYCGLWAWIAFQEGLNGSVQSIVGNAHLVKRMAFPIEILAPSAVFSALALQGMGFSLFFAYLLLFGKIPWTGVFHLPWVLIPLTLQVLFTLGLGWLCAAVQVFIRDTAQVVTAAVTVWFFLTPVIYPMDLVPVGFQKVLVLNPWTHLVSMYRGAVFEGKIPWDGGFAYLMACSVLVYWAGYKVFQKLKGEFADAL